MRTKTLLIAAAALAMGIISSEAQVYSQNVVGYYNLTLTPGASAFIANQLQTVNTAGAYLPQYSTNNINDVLSAGLFSDGNTVTNSVLYFWNGGGYTTYTYYNASDSGGSAGWYDELGNYVTNACLNQVGGSFLQNAALVNMTATFVGTVQQGTNQYNVVTGVQPYSIPEPVSTNIDSALVNFPANSSDDGNTVYDTYYHYNGNGWDSYFYYNFAATSGSPGWYDELGNPVDANPASYPSIGQAFFIDHEVVPGYTWTNAFVVPTN